MAANINATYKDIPKVNLDLLCETSPRLALARRIAERRRFFHWELEFADVFARRGGFDLVLGNPPWIKLVWKEKDVLAETKPLYFIKDLSATAIREIEKARALSLSL
jgi:hypothetical protein